jgi:hypothetical protein
LKYYPVFEKYAPTWRSGKRHIVPFNNKKNYNLTVDTEHGAGN